MYCRNCGNRVDDGDQFCRKCGSRVDGYDRDEGGYRQNDGYNKNGGYNQYGGYDQGGSYDPYGGYEYPHSHLYGVIAYITWIGFIIALILSNKNDRFARFHLNQALVINLVEIVAAVLAYIPLIGWIVSGVIDIFCLVVWFMAIIGAIKGIMKVVPIIGNIHLIG